MSPVRAQEKVTMRQAEHHDSPGGQAWKRVSRVISKRASESGDVAAQ